MFQNQLCKEAAAAATAAVDCRPRQELIARRARWACPSSYLIGKHYQNDVTRLRDLCSLQVPAISQTCSLVREAQTPYVSHVYGG